MRLKEFKIKNFRGYQNEVSIKLSDLSVLIGKNDIGKSTVLEALNIFFNGKPDKEDLNVDTIENQIVFTAIFDSLPTEIILDDSSPTNLKEEYLLNRNEELEIIKKFKVGATLTEESFVKCVVPNIPDLEAILSKKLSSLKLMAEELKIDTTGIDCRKSKDLRKVIRQHFLGSAFDVAIILQEIKIDGKLDNEDNLKKIWSSLKSYLPIYSLFFVDKPLNDQDSDIQDPMKEIVKEVLQRPTIAPLLDKLKNEIQAASTIMAEQTIQKLNEIDSRLAETLKSVFPKEPIWNSIFKLTLEDDRGVPLNKRGSGMRRLVLLSFFRAQIENRAIGNSPNIIYALEEPETSQHPDFQLMIVNALKELSETENAQVIFTTHNSNLAKEIPIQYLRYINKESSGVTIESGINPDGTENPNIIDEIVTTLGALPDPKNKVKVLIFVEGEKDINALILYSKLIRSVDSSLPLLENNESVAFIPVGGSQLKFYIEKKYLDGLTQSQIHIYDADIKDYIERVTALNAEGNPKKIGFNTSVREMENYLHPAAINECYLANNIAISVPNFTSTDDVPLITAKLVYEANSVNDWNHIDIDPIKNDKKQKKKISQAKHQLNNLAVEKMTIERLRSTNGFDEIKSWLQQIKYFIDN
jgi:putative ATP-dependent endonuclease of the OLD family